MGSPVEPPLGRQFKLALLVTALVGGLAGLAWWLAFEPLWLAGGSMLVSVYRPNASTVCPAIEGSLR